MLLPYTAPARPRARTRPLTSVRRFAPARPAGGWEPATTGRALVIVAFVTAGLGSPLAKTAFDLGATPLSFLSTRLAAAVVVLAVLSGRRALIPGPRRIRRLLVLGACFGAQSLAYFTALERSPVALVVVIMSSYPLVIIVGDAISARTMPGPGRLLGMGVALIGLWMAADTPTGRLDIGIVLALSSAIAYATYVRVSARELTTATPKVATLWVLTGALVGVGAAALVTGQSVPPAPALLLSVLHGAVATTVPIVSVYAALQRIAASDMAALGPLEPVVATGVATTLMGERLSPVEVTGAAMLVIAAVTMAGIRPRAALPRLPFAVPRRSRPVAVAEHPPVAAWESTRPTSATSESTRPTSATSESTRPTCATSEST